MNESRSVVAKGHTFNFNKGVDKNVSSDRVKN